VAHRDSRLLLLIAIGEALLFGLSALYDGLYGLALWGPVTIALAVLLVAAAVAGQVELSRLGVIAVGGLLLMLLWAAVSFSWTESRDGAWTEFGRLGLYAIILTTALISIRSDARARAVLWTIGVAVSVAGAYVVVRCLSGSGAELFNGFRLIEPLGYFNGQAAYFCLGFWALFGLAERGRRPAMGAVALMLATMVLEVAVLSQSRGAAAGFIGAAVVVLAAFPGRLRRAWQLAVVAIAVAIALPTLLDVYADRLSPGAGNFPSAGALHSAALAILLTSAAAGLAWLVAMRLGERTEAAPLARRLAAGLLVVIVTVAAVGLLVAVRDPVARARTAYSEFVSPASERQTAESLRASQRFTTTSGSRYHQWQLALKAFGSAPFEGLGGGNYGAFWIQHKKTTDYVTQPHSLTLQALAELGVVGALGFLLFAGTVLFAAVRLGRGAIARSELPVVVACAGIFIAWFVQTNADWLHNLPGVTGIALLAAGVLLTRARGAAPATRVFPRGSAAVAVLGAGLVAAAVGVLWRADADRAEARASLKRDPTSAIEAANRSIALNPERVDTYVVKAAAYARKGDYAAARQVLMVAGRKEPHNYVPWALLGDLAIRRRLPDQARRSYRRASRLNPSDRGLARLPGLIPGRDGS
jgi:hypothetical protein